MVLALLCSTLLLLAVVHGWVRWRQIRRQSQRRSTSQWITDLAQLRDRAEE